MYNTAIRRCSMKKGFSSKANIEMLYTLLPSWRFMMNKNKSKALGSPASKNTI